MCLVDTDDEFAISYLGVTPGVPVLTKDGTEFGILEHVLDVPEIDIFEGIVVWVGGGTWADRLIQHDLSRGHLSAARRIEAFRPHHLRFVEAGKIAVITVSYIRCDLDPDRVLSWLFARCIQESAEWPALAEVARTIAPA